MDRDIAGIKQKVPVTSLDKFVINLEALFSRVSLVLQRLENLLTQMVVKDNDIEISSLNRLFDRAGDLFDEAVRARAANNRAQTEQLLLTALLVAEESLDAAGKLLAKNAKDRFPAVEQYIISQEPVGWARVRLERARYLMKRPPPPNIWERALDNLLVVELLVEGYAIAFCGVRDKGRLAGSKSPKRDSAISQVETARLFNT